SKTAVGFDAAHVRALIWGLSFLGFSMAGFFAEQYPAKNIFSEYAYPNLIWCTFARKRPLQRPPTQKMERAPASGFIFGGAGGHPLRFFPPAFL
ncbi:MAG TPA: hypothetical protein H9833_09125, partial [Candidatus Evtepia faecavium]|nr:hypothetical protein [Candidatus Evtepia faecavium]